MRAGLGQLPLYSRPMFAVMFGAFQAARIVIFNRVEEERRGKPAVVEQISGQTLGAHVVTYLSLSSCSALSDDTSDWDRCDTVEADNMIMSSIAMVALS